MRNPAKHSAGGTIPHRTAPHRTAATRRTDQALRFRSGLVWSGLQEPLEVARSAVIALAQSCDAPPLGELGACAEGADEPRLHRGWAHPAHICAGTGPTPAHICTGTAWCGDGGEPG